MGLVIVVIGGGAAGYFGAIACAQANPDNKIILLEKNRQVLAKVKISGGGRCNVTHACFDPALLVQNYPRGNKALRGPFSRFQPKDTIQWFESRGVQLKTESDGRMFPTTDTSETIIHCLTQEAKKSGVEVRVEKNVKHIERMPFGFNIDLDSDKLTCDRILMATGSNPKIYEILKMFGHQIIPLVPSLFTFNIPNSPLLSLSGISIAKTHLSLMNTSLEQTGPLLITHWGFSGPAILKLSAWGARILHDLNYKADLKINWLPDLSSEILKQTLLNTPFVQVPRNLWKALTQAAKLPVDLRWATFSNTQLNQIVNILHSNIYKIDGKSTYKEEFVTCGGVDLNEVNFKTMESRICPHLYFAGEVLDIDGITGGFNFQNTWTTAWIAGQAMSFFA
jgi:predicted Rossmann fold flavoprotein